MLKLALLQKKTPALASPFWAELLALVRRVLLSAAASLLADERVLGATVGEGVVRSLGGASGGEWSFACAGCGRRCRLARGAGAVAGWDALCGVRADALWLLSWDCCLP